MPDSTLGGPPPTARVPRTTWTAVMLALGSASVLSTHAATAPPTLVPLGRDSIVAAVERERAQTEQWLKGSATSYLAAIRRLDFDGRPNLTVGRALRNDLRVEDSTITARHLRVTVAGDSFRVEALDSEAHFTVSGAVQREAVVGPSSIGVGRFTLRLSHQRFPALILFDPWSPRLREVKPLQYYPVDLAYRFVVALKADSRRDTVLILSTRGNTRRAVRAGWFEFEVRGKKCRLEATRLLEPGIGENDVGVFFKDATSGKETYPLGRYLDPERLPDGRWVLDFNKAYNPACAFSDHYNCPIPPKGNALGVAIRAGEKDSHYLDH